MPVHDRSWRPWEGTRAPARTRWRVVARYALADALRPKFSFLAFCAAFLPPLVAATAIYLRHNLAALEALDLTPAQLVPVDRWFFFIFMAWQSFAFGGILALLTGPGLVSADLTHGGLPLYLARPLTRTRYVLGKLAVLAGLLSLVTWVPGLLLFALAGLLEGWDWAAGNARIALAILAGSAAWIAVLSLLTLAASALARRKATAQLLLVAAVFGGTWVGNASKVALDTSWGHVFSLPEIMRSLLQGLYGVNLAAELPTVGAAFALPAIALAAVLVLARRLKAVEIVR